MDFFTDFFTIIMILLAIVMVLLFVEQEIEMKTLKRFFFPITVRFLESDALLGTFYFLDRVEKDKLNDDPLWQQSQKTKFAIAKELIRRKIEFWD